MVYPSMSGFRRLCSTYHSQQNIMLDAPAYVSVLDNLILGCLPPMTLNCGAKYYTRNVKS